MRWLPKAIPCLVCSVSLYFALWFGIEALRIFLSPMYGLDDPAFAQILHGIGRPADLGMAGLVKLGAFFGAVKLAIATLFIVYLVGRLRAIWRSEIEHEVLDAGLLLVVLVTVIAAMPALFDGATNVLAQYRLPLWLTGLAATLSMVERFAEKDGDTNRLETIKAEEARVRAFGLAALPPRRYGVSALRWNDLRRSAGLTN